MAEIKQRIDLVEIVNERVNLTKAGRNFKGLCPFHAEKTPSFFVTPEMQTYKCFGCGAGGDVYSFLEAFEGYSFVEALEHMAKRAGVTLVRQSVKGDPRRDRLLEALHLSAEYYHYLLTKHRVGQKAREYLISRGVTEAVIKDYQLGYAAKDWDGLQTFMVSKKGYKAEELLAVGMVIKRSGSSGYYDRFRGRIMFPLTDFAGHIVGFSGRLLEKEAKEAKYINTPETDLYHKRELLFGLKQARRAIRERDRAVIVEGELDVISSQKAGVNETVGVKGSALTEEQVMKLRRLTHNLILAMDADQAGQEAMKRAIEVAEKMEMNLRVVQLPLGKDPDELVKQDPKGWREAVKASMSVYEFYLNYAVNRFDIKTGQGQKEISRLMARVLTKIENAVERDFWTKKLAERLGVSERVVEEEVVKAGRKQEIGQKERAEEVKKERPLGRRERLERYVLGLLLQFPHEADEPLEQLNQEWFEEHYLKTLVNSLKQLSDKGIKAVSLWQAKLKPAQKELLNELYTADNELMELDEASLSTVYKRAVRDLEQLSVKEKLNQLSKDLGSFKGSDTELKRLQTEYHSLSERLNVDSA